MKGITTIIFNDLTVATTDRYISYEKETDEQKKYRFTNIKSGLTAVLFCEKLNIIHNESVVVEIN
ncbi:MAG: hypothetical protein R6V47_05925 [Candidatus Delongbacteria bacterium]